MLERTRVAASETHELCLVPSRTRFPNSPLRRRRHPHHPRISFSSLFHCDRYCKFRRSTVPYPPCKAGKPPSATAQLHTLPPTSPTAPCLPIHHHKRPPDHIEARFAPVKYNTMVGLTSAAGVVGFLSEPDPALRSFALQRLNEEIDLLWPEVAGSVSQM